MIKINYPDVVPSTTMTDPFYNLQCVQRYEQKGNIVSNPVVNYVPSWVVEKTEEREQKKWSLQATMVIIYCMLSGLLIGIELLLSGRFETAPITPIFLLGYLCLELITRLWDHSFFVFVGANLVALYLNLMMSLGWYIIASLYFVDNLELFTISCILVYSAGVFCKIALLFFLAKYVGFIKNEDKV